MCGRGGFSRRGPLLAPCYLMLYALNRYAALVPRTRGLGFLYLYFIRPFMAVAGRGN